MSSSRETEIGCPTLDFFCSILGTEKKQFVQLLTRTVNIVILITSHVHNKHIVILRACLFQLFCWFWSPEATVLWTDKRLAFQPTSMIIDLVKTVQNQHEYTIGRIITIEGIRHFLDPKHYVPLRIPPHVIPTILRFSPTRPQPNSPHNQILRKAHKKKPKQTSP
jgi:hypothetical protein